MLALPVPTPANATANATAAPAPRAPLASLAPKPPTDRAQAPRGPRTSPRCPPRPSTATGPSCPCPSCTRIGFQSFIQETFPRSLGRALERHSAQRSPRTSKWVGPSVRRSMIYIYCKLKSQVVTCDLQVVTYPVTSHNLQVTSYNLQVPSHNLQLTSHKSQVHNMVFY